MRVQVVLLAVALQCQSQLMAPERSQEAPKRLQEASKYSNMRVQVDLAVALQFQFQLARFSGSAKLFFLRYSTLALVKKLE